VGLHRRYKLLLQGYHRHVTLDKKDEERVRAKLTTAFRGMMSALFREKGATLDINILASDEAQHFINTHAATLDQAFQKVEMTEAMRRRLTRSDYIFSGIKTFHELNEAFPSLLDENGNRKSFNQFYNDVQHIDKTYNQNYLYAEYNFVHASAEMAAKWEQFAQDGDRYNLQYRTAGDDKVRPEHAALNGVTLPMSDPFWETYYPPNGWNCRCTVVQVRKSKYATTPRDEAIARGEEALQSDTKGIFRFNPGKQQKSVPDYNPYTIKRCRDCDIAKGKTNLVFIPDNELCAACRKIHECWRRKQDNEAETFTTCPTHRGKLRVSSKHGAREKRENVRIGSYLANKHGWEIDLMANPDGVTSADSYNKSLEVKQEYKVSSSGSKSSIDYLLRYGAKQADNVVLVLPPDVSLDKLSSAMHDRVRRTNLKTVMIIIDGKDKTYTFDEITAKGFKVRQADLT